MYADDGRLLLVFTSSSDTRDGRPWADGVWRPSGVSVADVVEAIADAFSGWAFSTADADLVAALTDAGATRLRHAHVMSHSLASLPVVAPTAGLARGLAVGPLDAAQVARNADRLGALRFAAYPAGHPDHSDNDVAEAVAGMRAAARGEVLGPVMEVSRVALYVGQIVGACLVVDRAGVPPDGGPWILDVFRDPDITVPGVGRSLLAAVLSAAGRAGLPGVSLAVSHDNTRALGLYGALGFADAGESWTLALP